MSKAIKNTISANGITIASTDYTAGAITSLIWNRQQFINAYDHGRELQSAVSFDNLGEAFNPTEAGSYLDGNCPNNSTSVLLSSSVGTGVMQTRTQMAFWNPVNGVALSDHIVDKTTRIGYKGLTNVIQHTITFTIPANETHSIGQFEVLTGYMPSSFSRFNTLNLSTGQLSSLSDGPGEQSDPIIFTDNRGKFAMGCYSPTTLTNGGYGRWRFQADNCVKWNMVSRINNPSGSYTFTVYTIVGTLASVIASMKALAL
jgi:hypothetical protein